MDPEAAESAKGILQDIVVVVSLVRTLTESFGSASDLYRKLKRKREQLEGDDDESERQHRPLHKRRDSNSDSDERKRDRLLRWGRNKSRGKSRRRADYSDSDEESIDTSSSVVRAEYDRGYHHLGDKFARGDVIAQNQLQAQIIALQQTLLNIYQEIALGSHTPPNPSKFHLSQLAHTTRAARAASVEALALQYQRMAHNVHPHIPDDLPVPGAFPVPPMSGSHELVVRRRKSRSRPRSRSSSPSSSDSHKSRPKKPPHKPVPQSLFCVYARDLQNDRHLRLSDNYKHGGNSKCPFCQTHITVRANRAWEVVKEDEHRKSLDRTFFVGARFVVKCHREGGGFACLLCRRHRKSDTICSEIKSLIEHIWEEHESNELERDEDIEEAGR